jgi:HD-GYP domain-containing protein (c-di-GMP phosphodiesterase class II)
MKKLPRNMKIYLAAVYILTVATFLLLKNYEYITWNKANLLNMVFFSLLIALTESFTVSFKSMSFSTTFAMELAAYLLFGPTVTILAVILGFSIRAVKYPDGKYRHILNTPFYGTVFNFCVLIQPIMLANYVYIKMGGGFVQNNILPNFFQVAVFSLLCFSVNMMLISILMAITTKKNLIYLFVSNVKLVLINFIIMVPFGIGLTYMYNELSYIGVLLLLFPVMLVRFTFSLYIDAKTQYIQTVDSLMRAVEARDKYTEGHSQRVAKIVEMIAREMKLGEFKIEMLNIASMMHDVGKIGVDDSILNKPGKLTEDEFNAIKMHPEIGYNILKDVKNLEGVIELVRHHHERYDGRGYPDGKSKDDLSMDVFIIQLADAIDAMATDRPYRKALTEKDIMFEIHKYSGTQFHPDVVEAYINAIDKKREL